LFYAGTYLRESDNPEARGNPECHGLIDIINFEFNTYILIIIIIIIITIIIIIIT